MKITLHLKDGRKINFYKNITIWQSLCDQTVPLVQQYVNQTGINYELYWIDSDRDEIQLTNALDFEIFLNENKQKPHLHINLTDGRNDNSKEENKQQESSTTTADNVKQQSATENQNEQQQERAASSIVHEHVECDGCNKIPVVGFRYKCIQCPNYDLCERCEAEHKHSHHMMVRMPHNKCPNVVQSWIETGRHHGGRRSARKHCPFMDFEVGDEDAAATTGATAAGNEANGTTEAEGKDRRRHHGRKHHKRDMRSNFFSNLYCMMHDLAEGGGSFSNNANATAPTFEQTNAAAAVKEATAAAEAAAKEATAAAEAAAKEATAAVKVPVAEILTTLVDNYAKLSASVEEPTQTKSAEQSTESVNQSPNNANNSNNTTTPISSPSLENLAQFIDPKYMKAGLQILSNFNDMFGKMIDPSVMGSDVNSSMSCPLNFETRNNSTASMASNMTDASASTSTNSNKNTTQVETTQQNSEQPIAATAEAATTTETTTAEAVAQTPVAAQRNRSHSPNVESDWQLIDDNSDESNVSNNSSPSSEARNVVTSPISTPIQLDYEKLRQDLHAHIEQEKQRAEIATAAATEAVNATPATVAKLENQTAAATTTTNTVSTANPTAAATVAANTATATAAAAAATNTVPKQEESRAVPVYHPDQRINNAVLAMMAMGFSNEGACLTQLLDSVNGNIPEALDLMSEAQLPTHRR